MISFNNYLLSVRENSWCWGIQQPEIFLWQFRTYPCWWNQCRILCFWPHWVACGILVSGSGIEPVPPALEVQSLNHWTAREVPNAVLVAVCSLHLLGKLEKVRPPSFLFRSLHMAFLRWAIAFVLQKVRTLCERHHWRWAAFCILDISVCYNGSLIIMIYLSLVIIFF